MVLLQYMPKLLWVNVNSLTQIHYVQRISIVGKIRSEILIHVIFSVNQGHIFRCCCHVIRSINRICQLVSNFVLTSLADRLITFAK